PRDNIRRLHGKEDIVSLHDRLLLIAKAALDLVTLAAAFVLAFLIRFEGSIPGPMIAILIVSLPCLLMVKSLAFPVFGVERLPCRCVSLIEVKRIFQALVAGSAVLVALRLAAAALSAQFPALGFLQMPLGVLAIDFALSLLGTGGVRVGYRLLM